MKFVFSMIVPCNCLDTVSLAQPFWALTTFPVCFSALSCWTNTALPHCLPPLFFTVVTEAACLQVTPISLMALWICLSTFPLWALLICGVTIYSPRESRYRRLRLFFFCCQLGNFSIAVWGIVSKANVLLISYKCIP